MRLLNRVFILLIFITVASCEKEAETSKPKIVTTTSMITDLVKQIGGDSIQVTGLMGAGVDPHLFKASEGDVHKLSSADLIFYNGLHLEGKMVDVFQKMNQSGYRTAALSESLDPSDLLASEEFSDNYDPHIWFSVNNWKQCARYVTSELNKLHPQSKSYFDERLRIYLMNLETLELELKQMVDILPREKRILVTAHDAFGYLGKEFDFEVIGLQGISTSSEAGTRDLLELASLIIEKEIPAVFVESSVPEKTIKALQSAVKDKNGHIELGGTLFSDALGNPGTPQGTYTGMYRTNMETIINALNTYE